MNRLHPACKAGALPIELQPRRCIMKEIINRLDSIADRLEERGLLKEAIDLDLITNTLEAALPGAKVEKPKDPDKAAIKILDAVLNRMTAFLSSLKTKLVGFMSDAKKDVIDSEIKNKLKEKYPDLVLGDIGKDTANSYLKKLLDPQNSHLAILFKMVLSENEETFSKFLPEGTSTADAVKIIMVYLKEHPEKLDPLYKSLALAG